MSDCSTHIFDVRIIRGEIHWDDGERPMLFSCAKHVNGRERKVEYIELDGERFERVRECEPVVGDGENAVPLYQTGCSECGCVWDWFYITSGFSGPPNRCPKCGARVKGIES